MEIPSGKERTLEAEPYCIFPCEYQEKYKLLYENGTFKMDHIYYCYKCDEIFTKWWLVHLHASQDLEAIPQSVQDAMCKPGQNFTVRVYEELLSSGFVPRSSGVCCMMCSEVVQESDVWKHTNEAKHNERREKFVKNLWERVKFEELLDDSDSTVESDGMLIDELSKRELDYIMMSDKHTTSVGHRSHCPEDVKISQEIEEEARKRESKVESEQKSLTTREKQDMASCCIYVVRQNARKSICNICGDHGDMSISTKKIQEHVDEQRHREALKVYGCNKITPRDDGVYYCECCHQELANLRDVHLHVKDKKHTSSLIKVVSSRSINKKLPVGITSLSSSSSSSSSSPPPPPPKDSDKDKIKTKFEDSTDSGMEEKRVKLSSPSGNQKAVNEQSINNRTLRQNNRIKKKSRNYFEKEKCCMCKLEFENTLQLHSHLAEHIVDEIVNRTENDSTAEGTFFQEEQPDDVKNGEADDEDDSNEEIPDKTPKRQDEEKKTSVTRIDRRKLIQILNFNADEIYDMKDKIADAIYESRLCLIVNSELLYCLVCRKTFVNTTEKYLEHVRNLDHCDYLELMLNDDKRFDDYSDQLSDLRLALEYMEEMSESLVRCHACGVDLVNNNQVLRKHFDDNNHERSRGRHESNSSSIYDNLKSSGGLQCDWYRVNKYWCVPCEKYFNDEVSFLKHMQNKLEMHYALQARYDKMMILDFCECCSLLWYGFRNTYPYHSDIATHKLLSRDGYFFNNDLPKFAKALLSRFEQYADETIHRLDEIAPNEKKMEDRLLRDLETTVRTKFVRAKAYIFGSRSSGVGLEGSDVDVFLDCGNMYKGQESLKSTMQYFMDGVYQCLKNKPQIWKIEELVTRCRTPIIKVCHIETGLACDISFESGLAVENTKLIRSFITMYPPCRKLILVLKKWLGYCNLSGSNYITSYTLYWYVIFYLQTEGIFPSVAFLTSMKNKSCIIKGWETGVSHNFTCIKPERSLGLKELLARFFIFYSNFDFRFHVVCPLLGEAVKKIDFIDPQKLPVEMKPYKEYMNRAEKMEGFRIDSVMCIQDPFDLQHNLAKAVKKPDLNRFRAYCSKSLDLLSSSQ